MRHWNDMHESLAAPSPFVPTRRSRPPSSSKPGHYHSSMTTGPSATTLATKHSYPSDSIANNGRLLPSPPSNASFADEGSDNKNGVPDQLGRFLQTPPLPPPSPPSSSGSASSFSQPAIQTTTTRDMFKAGHRRLRQLAQRQKKDVDVRADEERQLAALRHDGFLPANDAPKESLDSSLTPSISHARGKSSSRRDVERIGQPWLDDPLALEPLSSDGRLASLDLSELSEFMMNSGFDELVSPPARTSSNKSAQSQTPAAASTTTEKSSHLNADPVLRPSTQQQANESQSKPAPRNTPALKLFPDPLPPPRISSKAALRMSKCPPPNGPPATSTHLPPLRETSKERNIPSSAAKLTSPKEPTSAPASTQHFAQADRPNTDASRPSSNPVSAAISAFPLPAPTRPLPSLPTATTITRRIGPKKSRRTRALQSPDASGRDTPRAVSTDILRPTPSRLHVGADEFRSRSAEPRPHGAPLSHETKARRSAEFSGVQRDAISSPASSPLLSANQVPAQHHVRRTNSHRDSAVGFRSEYPIPSSDEEGAGIDGKRWAQNKRRHAKARPLHRVSRVERPESASTPSLSPVGRSSPSQHSQSSYGSTSFHTLESRIAQLERNNKVLQAALFAALDAGNDKESISETVASLLSDSAPSSKSTPASSIDEPVEGGGRFSRTAKSRKRESWLDTNDSRPSSAQSGFSAHKELERIPDIEPGWLSDGDSLRVLV